MPPGVSESRVASAVDQVLAPAFLGHLGRMRLAVRRAYGPRPGDTPVRGLVQPSGLELERHKPYDQGDELRFLDWNAYARLDQLLVRQFRAEREAPVHIFLDGSASMASPAEDGKFPFAVGLALGMAYVAVRHHNPVRIVLLAADRRLSPTIRFPALLHRLAEFCAHLSAGGPTLLDGGIDEYLQSQAGPGLAVLISDFLVEAEVTRALLHRLASRGYETAALRPIGPGERDPSTLFKRARVRDVETGREKVVRLGEENLERYRQALAEHFATLERDCADNEARFAVCEVAAGLDHCFFSQLPQAGMLR
jgi:uncharacterized protein (DUF58 family)